MPKNHPTLALGNKVGKMLPSPGPIQTTSSGQSLVNKIRGNSGAWGGGKW